MGNLTQGFRIWTTWEWEHWRWKGSGPQQIDGHTSSNIVTDEGINWLLGANWYDDDEIISDWYLCVFEDDYTPLITDTYAVPGYTECDTLQDATRPAFQAGAAAAKSISNVSNKASFTFSVNKTIYGGSMVGGGSDADTIADTAGGGVLFCASKYSGGSQLIIANDVIKVTVTLTGASG